MSDFRNIPLGQDIVTMDVSPDFQPYSGVEIIVSEDTTFFSGNRTGRVLTLENPWGTREQADAILANLQGFTYRPYTATGALLNPAAEIGDGVTINGIYSGIYKLSQNYSPLMSADIEAPEDEEIDHEFPYESKQEREYKREISEAKAQISLTSDAITAEVTRATEAEGTLASRITQNADSINAKVSQTGGNNSSFGWSLLSNQFSLYAGSKEVFKCTASGVEIQGKITATSGYIGNGSSGFTITASSLYNGMSNINSTANGVYIGTNGIAVGGGKFKVTSSGAVSATNMTLTGTLNIGGSTITAAALRSGAQSAYSNGGTWSGTSTAWGNATTNGTSRYPSYFTAGALTCSSIRVSSINFNGRSLSAGSIPNGNGGYWKVVMWS